ncbi:MAG: AIPR family protein [Candidatus Hydrogenedentes bacterium]|nr:AIPR family protein [Candidatus Hydrogenedentota bacterium]
MSQNDLILLNQLLEQRLSSAESESDPSEFFELFSAEQLLKDEDLSYEELETGLIDSGGDGGIDGFYFFVNGTLFCEDLDLSTFKKNIELKVVLLQAKTSSGFSEDAMDRFTSATRELFNLNCPVKELRKVYHKDLLLKVEQFREAYLAFTSRFPSLKFLYGYSAKATEAHPNVKRKVNIIHETLKKAISPVAFEFVFLDASKLLSLARETPSTTHKLPLAESPISTGQEGFVCLVPLRSFFEFVKDDQGRLRSHLFEGNVRDYQGNVEVNKEIRQTLESVTPEDFWWLNNGISMLCSNASLSGKVLTIEDPEIVNGLQTSREIFEVLTRRASTEEKRHLLVRVIKPQDESSRDRIIKATNSQTAIPPASLRATDKIHRDIEEFLLPRGWFYDRRKNFYKNSGKPAKKIVSIPFLAQSVIACALREPANARARPSTLIKDDAAYTRIFDPSYPLDLYYKALVIGKTCETYLKSGKCREFKEHANNLRFYVATLVVLRLCEVPKPSISAIAALDLASLTEGVVVASKDVYRAYKSLGGNDQVAKGNELEKKLLANHAKKCVKGFRKNAKTK